MNAITMYTQTTTTPLEHFCAPLIHPITGKSITNYKNWQKTQQQDKSGQQHLVRNGENWHREITKTGTKGTKSMFVIDHKEIKWIPADFTITYTNILVDYFPQKSDPNRFIITAGGNLINYPGELTAGTADLTTSKILRNSIFSTIGAKNMCVDIKILLLHTIRPTGIHAHTIVSVHRTHQKSVQLKIEGTKWIFLR